MTADRGAASVTLDTDVGLRRLLMVLQCAQIFNARGDTEREQRSIAVARCVAERYGLPFDPPCWEAS